MPHPKSQQLPPELAPTLAKARKLEWLTLAYQASVVVVMYLSLGQSQAMKTAWADDLLGMIAPTSFLLAAHFEQRGATHRFPYGYHRAATVGFLAAAATLLTIGTLLFIDGVQKLLSGERASIGMVPVFGHPVWAGYLMLLALLWSTVPANLLGRAKQPVAKQLHDKVLFADADTNRVDWQMGVASMLGIVGIGFGWWWADASVGILLSASIISDGYHNLRHAVADLLSQRPKALGQGSDEEDPLVQQLCDLLTGLDWVRAARLRLRAEGHVLYGEAFIVPRTTENLLPHLQQATAAAHRLHWRIRDLVLTVVDELPE